MSRPVSPSRRLVLLLALVLALSAVLPASAATRAVYATTDYQSGILGVTSGDQTVRVGSTGGDPAVRTFSKGDGSVRVLARQTNNYGADEDSVTIYDPTAWSVEANFRAGHNISGAAAIGSSLFLADYYNDGSSSLLLKLNTAGGYAETGRLNLDDGDGSNYFEYVKDVLAVNGVLYVLVERRDANWPPNHANGSVVKVDPATMTVLASVEVAPNPASFAYSPKNGRIYVACIGGARNVAGVPGETRIAEVTLSGSLSAQVFATRAQLPSGLEKYAFDQIGATDDGRLFVTAYYNDAVDWTSGQANPCKVLVSSVSSPSFAQIGAYSGWIGRGVCDPETGNFWVSHRGTGQGDGCVARLNAAGEAQRWSETALGGLPYDLTLLEESGQGGGGSGGGGCSGLGTSPFAALALLLPLFSLLRSRRSR
jgi:hypothetical protein